MNPSDVAPSSVEGRETREIVADEDVLSHGLARELESVGTAIGFVAAFALICAHLARGARAVAAITVPASTTTRGAGHA